MNPNELVEKRITLDRDTECFQFIISKTKISLAPEISFLNLIIHI